MFFPPPFYFILIDSTPVEFLLGWIFPNYHLEFSLQLEKIHPRSGDSNVRLVTEDIAISEYPEEMIPEMVVGTWPKYEHF